MLRAAGVLRSASVVSVQGEPLGEDKGFFAWIVRLHLTYNRTEERAPHRLIAKFSSANPEMRHRAVGAYTREVRFYSEFAPESSLPVPTCYYADIDTDTGYHLLLLEDLAPAQNGNRVLGGSAEQARIAVHQIAHFHSHWWGNPHLVTLDWLQNAPPDSARLRELHQGWWQSFLTSTQDHLSEPIRKLGERLGDYRGAIMSRLFFESPYTLIHRDYHLDNLFFATPEGGRFSVVDWQSVCRGCGIWDVGYFLCQNLEPEQRRAVEGELLQEYHQILCQNGVTNYSLADCWRDYRFALLQRFGALISTIATMPFTAEQRQLHIDLLLPRNIAALTENSAESILNELSMPSHTVS
jgi:hypothetical protein